MDEEVSDSMHTLIQLLLENIYVVVIALGFLFSVLSKMRKSNAPRGLQMPDFSGGGKPAPSKRQDNGGQPDYREVDEDDRWEENSASSTVPAAPVQASRTSPFASESRTPSTLTAVSNRPRPVSPPAKQAGKTSSGFAMPEGDELRRAIVLAEVLGPPRSKRPLRRL